MRRTHLRQLQCLGRSGAAGRILLRLGALCLLPMCAAIAFCDQASPYRITGVVVSERDGAPVPHSHVTAGLSGGAVPQRNRRPRPGNRESSPAADTDSNGHFTLVLPSSGSWQVYAYGRGFRQQAYDRHENFFSAVVLTPAVPAADIVFSLEPDSAVSGFVLDEAGEGVRNAHVTLFSAEPPDSELGGAQSSVRSSTMTDDRGHYEFAGLAPGDYDVSVQAQPWYAAGAQQQRRLGVSVSDQPPDAVLDVVYPQVWFPGVAERSSAETISLHHGEDREADFNLTPAPASHLRMSVPPTVTAGGQRAQFYPMIERVSSDGAPFVNTSMQVSQNGQIDVGGLSPGLYRVTLQGPGGSQTPAYIRVPAGAQHTLDLSAALPVGEVTLRFDPDEDPNRTQVIFTDVETGATFVSYGQNNLQRRRNSEPAAQPGGDRKLTVPPARYRVTLAGNGESFLGGISVRNTPLSGRVVTIASGSTTLDLKLTHGRASVHGIASLAGKPVSGAMVMLVPATFGEPDSITILRRDQTNTDGSFLISGVIPGDYILLAIDHGWSVNWHDPATLGRYLIQGVPVSLQPNASAELKLAALSP